MRSGCPATTHSSFTGSSSGRAAWFNAGYKLEEGTTFLEEGAPLKLEEEAIVAD